MEAVQMLQRFTQVGEFYVMSKPEGVPANTPGFMDLLIYDEEADRHVRISYVDALEATGLFTVSDRAAGTVAAAATVPGDTTEMFNDNNGTVVTFGTYKAAAIALAAANADGTDSEKVADAPVVLARPFIEHAMLSAVLTVSGGDTGATIFGPSDMQISANTSVKTIEGCDCLFEPTNTHSHAPYSIQLRGTGSLPRTHFLTPLRVCSQPLHRPLQGGHHQAPERVSDEGHHGQRIPRRRQRQVLWQDAYSHPTKLDEASQHGRHVRGRGHALYARIPNDD
jgi:hypothetical protein